MDTKEKLHRFGLTDSRQCPRCDEIVTFHPKLLKCNYVTRIWSEPFKITDTLLILPAPVNGLPTRPMGMVPHTDAIALTVHAEVLNRILTLKESCTFLLRPKNFVQCLKPSNSQGKTFERLKVNSFLVLGRWSVGRSWWGATLGSGAWVGISIGLGRGNPWLSKPGALHQVIRQDDEERGDTLARTRQMDAPFISQGVGKNRSSKWSGSRWGGNRH